MFIPEAKPIRVLLVGASGKLGKLVVHFWNDFSPLVTLVEQHRRRHPGNFVKWSPLDGHLQLSKFVDKFGNFDAMVILAGATPNSDNEYSLNKDIIVSCLSAANRLQIKKILVASSSAVYGSYKSTPFTETSKCIPENPYGISKLEMERECDIWRSKGLEICCLRIGNVVGADALSSNILSSTMENVLYLDVFPTGGGAIRSYIGPRTMASVIHSLCLYSGRLPETLNIASPAPVSMIDIAAASGKPWKSRHVCHGTNRSITLDCSALSKVYCFDGRDSDPNTMVAQWKETLVHETF
jgi:UDP-glucose 4-epimerase